MLTLEFYNMLLNMTKNSEQKTMFFRICASIVLFFIATLLNFMNLKIINFVGDVSRIINICLVAAYFISGYNIILATIKNTIKLNIFDENFLMFMATLGAFCLKENFEAVAIFLFYQISEFFQQVAVKQSEESVANLLKSSSKKVNLKTANGIVRTNPELIEIGATIVVKPGEQIPIDGTIISGTSQLNTSSLNGEFDPITAQPNDNVLSGYINLTHTLEIKTNTLFKNSTVKKMLNLIEKAKQKKAKSEKFITNFAKIYTPIVVLLAIVVAIAPPMVFKANWATWLQNAIVLISISCPCALIISIPLSFFGTISTCAKNSILIKASQSIEKINRIKTIVFDKTGTLTFGHFQIIEINPENTSENELINLLVAAESLTNHPIATAIKTHFRNVKFNTNQIIDFEELPGLGVKARTTNNTILVGNKKLMEKFGIYFTENKNNGNVIYIAKNKTYVGNVVVADKIKPEAKFVVEQLRKLKFSNIGLMTGDKKANSETISTSLKFNLSFFEQLPQEKAKKIEQLQKDHNPLVFIGDGINDSPALATAAVGVAMGKFGADIAIDSADVVLVDGDLKKTTFLIKAAKKTMRIVKQNLFFSVLIKALILATCMSGNANIWLSIFSDVGVSILAIMNSLRTLSN